MTIKLPAFLGIPAGVLALALPLAGPANASDGPGMMGNAYYGCLFIESQRNNQPMTAEGIGTAHEACREFALKYGDKVASRAGSPGGQAIRHNSKKFIQGYLMKEVPAGLAAAGLLK